MPKKMPIGIEDFGELIAENYYFVDKTYFIKQLLDEHAKVTLFTRPRRFGKTLTLSMLDYFFSCEKEKQSRDLFQALAIAKADKTYFAHRGQYPVLFFTLKNFSCRTWDEMIVLWQDFWQDVFRQHKNLCDTTRVDAELIAKFQKILKLQASITELSGAITLLMKMMHQYYGKKVVLLIDEYDAPIQQAWDKGFYDDAIVFMRQLLSSALKTNPDLDFAVLTGVLRVAKESIFSGLNNFLTCSVLEEAYSDAFGFTKAEVKKLLAENQLENKFAEVQAWYDGYRMGGKEIYNPWSVLNYVNNKCVPRAYWAHTSGNGILRLLLHGANMLQISLVQQLLQGNAVNVTINDSVIYPEIGKNQSALFTMLLTTGYLTVKKVISLEDERYALCIPNKEISKLYSTEILGSMTGDDSRDSFDNLFEFLLQGNAEYFSMQLQQILVRYVSSYDAANKESFYHGFMLGMTALFLGQAYVVESNRESGYGRFDIAIFPKDSHKAGVILEFKVAASDNELEAKAKEALNQIESRNYLAEFTKRGISTVWKYGIAFCGKQVCVLTENM